MTRTFGQQLKQWRKDAGFSQVALAEMAGCSKSAIGYWELGRIPQSKEVCIDIATALGVPIDTMLIAAGYQPVSDMIPAVATNTTSCMQCPDSRMAKCNRLVKNLQLPMLCEGLEERDIIGANGRGLVDELLSRYEEVK